MTGMFALQYGGHTTPDDGLCFMEAVAWVARLPHTDRPVCVCPAIGAFGRALNDRWTADERQQLLPYVCRTAGTNTSREDTVRRGYIAADFAVRIVLPLVCEWAGWSEDAAELRALPELVDRKTARAGQKIAERVRAAYAAYAAYADAAAAYAAADAAADATAAAYAYAAYAYAAYADAAAAYAAADAAADATAAAAAAYAAADADAASLRSARRAELVRLSLECLDRMIAVGKTTVTLDPERVALVCEARR